jgi:hypothetical protein
MRATRVAVLESLFEAQLCGMLWPAEQASHMKNANVFVDVDLTLPL